MQPDTISYDTLDARPLPKWLTDQKEGLTTIQPVKLEMREDNSLKYSFIITAFLIILAAVVLTVFFNRKYRNK
jgi:hypothetical protein